MRAVDKVAQQSGVPVSTLGFYEEKGVIASVGGRGLRRSQSGGAQCCQISQY